MSKEIVISSSKLDTFEGCSWEYWVKYHLKAPSKGNLGTAKGSVCHHIYELLLVERHRKHIEQIKADKTCRNIPSLWKYILKESDREGLFTPEHIDHVDEMVYNGIKEADFVPDPKKYDVVQEEEFKFQIHNNVYLRGFVDVLITNKKTQEMIIRDYKSSKQKHAPKKIQNNNQGMAYALYVYEKYGVIPDVEFWFLQFPNSIKQVMPKPTKAELNGFKSYLRMVGKQMEIFEFDHAKLGYAKNKPHPKKDEGFTGPLKCGFACRKGQLKKDSSPMYHCEYKFDSVFYFVKDEEGKIIDKSYDRKDLTKHQKEGKVIEEMMYKGCPAHR